MRIKNKNKMIKYLGAELLILAIFNFGAVSALALEKHEIDPEIMVNLTNGSRREAGLSELILNTQLASAAEKKADDMFQLQYFEHNSPDGKTPWVFIKSAGYEYVYAGENLAMDFVSAEGVHKALMESSSHRENILNVNYSDVGISVKKGLFKGAETIMVVEMFGLPVKRSAEVKAAEPAAEIAKKIQAPIAVKIDQEQAAVEVSASEDAEETAFEVQDAAIDLCEGSSTEGQAAETTEAGGDTEEFSLFAQDSLFTNLYVCSADTANAESKNGSVAGTVKEQKKTAYNSGPSAEYENYFAVLDMFKKEITLTLLSIAISMNLFYISSEEFSVDSG